MASRRTFLTQLGTAAAMAARRTLLAQVAPASGDGSAATRAREAATDVVIIDGGFGGCAAALAAARRGLRVVMTEETDWVGGQLTAQAVPLDENAWIEDVGVSRSYTALRQGIRDITNGCYRLHPVEWSIGEAAGSLAAFALARGVSPRAVRNTPDLLSDFQKSLRDDGVVLEWPRI